MLQRDIEGRRALERRFAGQDVITGHAQGIDVRPGVDRLAAHLLGRHVQRRAHHDAGGGEVQGRLAGKTPGQAKIGDLHLAFFREQNVLGLDVPVDKAQLPRAFQGARHLADDFNRDRRLGDAFFLEEITQVTTVDILEGHVMQPVGFADGVHLHDVGVGDAGDRLGLGLKAPQGRGVGGQVGLEDLDRDLALEAALAGEINGPHAADTDESNEVKVAQRATGEIGNSFSPRHGIGARQCTIRGVRHGMLDAVLQQISGTARPGVHGMRLSRRPSPSGTYPDHIAPGAAVDGPNIPPATAGCDAPRPFAVAACPGRGP